MVDNKDNSKLGTSRTSQTNVTSAEQIMPTEQNKYDDVTDEYLALFPSTLRACLIDNIDRRRNFAKKIVREYENLTVYRAVKYSDKILSTDFLGNAEKYYLEGKEYSPRWARKFENHSVSVNESVDELIENTNFPNSHITGIAKGYMKCKYGPADFTPDETHHNWYLFDGANEKVCKEFMIDEEITKKATEAKKA